MSSWTVSPEQFLQQTPAPTSDAAKFRVSPEEFLGQSAGRDDQKPADSVPGMEQLGGLPPGPPRPPNRILQSAPEASDAVRMAYEAKFGMPAPPTLGTAFKAPAEQIEAGAAKVAGAKTGRDVASGASDIIRGGLSAYTGPEVMGPAAAAGPLATALTVGGSMIAQKVTEAGLKKAGVPEEYAGFAGDVAGLLAGAGGGAALLRRAYRAAGSPEVKIGGKFPEPKPFREMTDEELVAHANKIERDPPKNYDWQKEQIVQEVAKRQAERGMPAGSPPSDQSAAAAPAVAPQAPEETPVSAPAQQTADIATGASYDLPSGKYQVTRVAGGRVFFKTEGAAGTQVGSLSMPAFRRMVAASKPAQGAPAAEPAPAATPSEWKVPPEEFLGNEPRPAAAATSEPPEGIAPGALFELPSGKYRVTLVDDGRVFFKEQRGVRVGSMSVDELRRRLDLLALARPLPKEGSPEPTSPAARPAAIAADAALSAPSESPISPTPETAAETPPASPLQPVAASAVTDAARGGEGESSQFAPSNEEPKREAPLLEPPPVHKNSSTQVNLPAPIADQVRAVAAAIPDEQLNPKEDTPRETEPHITVKYRAGDDPAAIQKLIENEPPITVTLGKVSVFHNEDGDVLKVSVDSPSLHALNEKIAKEHAHPDDYPEYKPHVTIAYLKPGEGKQYEGTDIEGVTGQKVTLDTVTFSGKDGQKTDIKLSGKPSPAEREPAAVESPAAVSAAPAPVAVEKPFTPAEKLAANEKRIAEIQEQLKARGAAVPVEKPPAANRNAAVALRRLADNMQAQIEAKQNPAIANQNPTARRARIAGGMAAEGERLERIQKGLQALADLHEKGEVPEVLQGIKTRGVFEAVMPRYDERGNRVASTFPGASLTQHDVRELLEKSKGTAGSAEGRKILERRQYSEIPHFTESEIPAIEKVLDAAVRRGYKDTWSRDRITGPKKLYAAGINEQNFAAAQDAIANLGVKKRGPTKEEQIREAERDLLGTKIEGFFPTPKPLVSRMVEAAGIQPGMSVLEPSAGSGAIADELAKTGANVTAVEPVDRLRKILELKGHALAADRDFLEHDPARDAELREDLGVSQEKLDAYDPEAGVRKLGNNWHYTTLEGNHSPLYDTKHEAVEAAIRHKELKQQQQENPSSYRDVVSVRARKQLALIRKYEDQGMSEMEAGAKARQDIPDETPGTYDRIVMNPPFERGQDIEHVRHAYELLKPGGRIVAVMGEGSFSRSDKKAADFRQWLEEHGGESEKLPAGSFTGKDSQRQTGVSTRLITIDKPPARQAVTVHPSYVAKAEESRAARAEFHRQQEAEEAASAAPERSKLKASAADSPRREPAAQEPAVHEPNGGVPEKSAGETAGHDTSVLIPGSDTEYPARYEVRELADLHSSHHAFSFQLNADYPYTNDRDYTKLENQKRVISQAQKFNPRFLITDNPDATNGPPVLDAEGNALGGNSRVMTLQRIYAQHPEHVDAYRKMLEARSAQYGIAPEQIRAMKQPVLVRIVPEAAVSQVQHAITDLNKTGTAKLGPSEQAIVDSRRVSPQALDFISREIDKLGEDGTLAKVIATDAGPEIVNLLAADGAITERDIPQYIADGKITQEGKIRLARLMIGRFFSDVQQFDNTPPNLKNKLERIVAPLARIEQRPDWDVLSSPIREAIGLLDEARAYNLSKLEDLDAQEGMFGKRKYSPEAYRWAYLLKNNAAKTLTAAFRNYAELESLSRPDTTVDMFAPPPVPQDVAYDEAFGALRGLKHVPESPAALQARALPGDQPLFGEEEESAANAGQQQHDNRLLGDQLTAQFKSGMAAKPTKLKPAENRGLFDEEGPEQTTLFARRMPGFYSQLQRAIEQKMPERASAGQALAIVQNPQNGVKPDELKWSGFEDWLRQQKRPVSKQQALDYLKANEVRVEEVTHGGQAEPHPIEWKPAGQDLWVSVGRFKPGEMIGGRFEIRGPNFKNGDWDGFQLMDGKHRRIIGGDFPSLESAQAAAAEFVGEEITPAPKTKFEQYTLPGGKNYRELLLTLPLTTELPDGFSAVQKGPDKWWVLGPGPLPENRYGAGATREEAIRSFAGHGHTAPIYRSSHWDEPNVIAHVRFSDRTGPNGEKVLHVEEIQSDWHQAGKRKGYRDLSPQEKAEKSRLDAKKEPLTEDEVDWYNRVVNDRKQYGVPGAPFAKTWHELAFRRALRYAAENGYDKVTWTTGEQQAERYDLSKHLTEIRYEKAGEGKYEISAIAKDGSEVIHEDEVGLDRIEELVGKEIAEKIAADHGLQANATNPEGDHENQDEKAHGLRSVYRDWKVLSGLDLKVGGEGMKGFYDQILPAYASRYGKKWAAKVGETEIAGASKNRAAALSPEKMAELHGLLKREDYLGFDSAAGARLAIAQSPDWADRWEIESPRLKDLLAEYHAAQNPPVRVHSIEITPSMRESVMQGQPLFARRPVSPDQLELFGERTTTEETIAKPARRHSTFTVNQKDIPSLPNAPYPAGSVATLHEMLSFWDGAGAKVGNLGGRPALFVNNSGMEVVLRRMGMLGNGGSAEHILGLTLGPGEWRNILEEANAAAHNPKPGGFEDALIRVANQIRKTLGLKPLEKNTEPKETRLPLFQHPADPGPPLPRRDEPLIVVQAGEGMRASVIKRIAEEEYDHASQMSLPRGLRGLPAEIVDTEAGEKAAKALQKFGYPKLKPESPFYRHNRSIIAAEIGVRLMRPDRWKDLGLTAQEARDLAEDYITGLQRMNGAQAGAIVDQIYESIVQGETAPTQGSGRREEPDQAPTEHAGEPGQERAGPGVGQDVPGDKPEALAARTGGKEQSGAAKRFLSDETGTSNVTPRLQDLGNWFTSKFGSNPDEPKVNYSGLGAASRVFLPGRNLAEVEQASRPVFEAAVSAGSADAITSTVLQSAVPAIRKAVADSPVTWDEMKLYYTESRLRGLRDRWMDFADQARHMTPVEVQQACAPLPSGEPSPFLDLLRHVQGRQGMPENLAQTAAAMVDAEDYQSLRRFLGDVFENAASRVATVMEPAYFDEIHEQVRTNPAVEQADRIYGELIEKPMAESHSANEGVFSDALGPAGRYIPLIPVDRKQTLPPGRRLAYHKPTNASNAFATGLSSGYSLEPEDLAKKLSASNRANYKANLLRTMEHERWLVPESESERTEDGKLVMTGPDGHRYRAVREEVQAARTIIGPNRRPMHTPARFMVMPTFMNRAMRPILAREPMDPNDVIDAMRWANMLATKGPLELVFHASGVLGSLYANTPFLGESGLDKALSVPLMKWFAIRGKLWNIDPTTPENVAKLHEMAVAGALPAKSAKVTYSKDFAEMTGATRERFSFGPMLYGPKGIDARARILMYDIFKAAYPNGTPQQLHHFVNQIGNYSPEMQGEIEKWLKRVGIGPFATAGMTRIVNSVHAYSGTGPGPGPSLKTRLWWWATASAWIALAAWIVAHEFLTGKSPADDKRAKLFQIPVGGGSGWIDQYRHSALGNGLWGSGPEVGYLNFAFLDNPLALRGARTLAMAGPFQTHQAGGNAGQMVEAGQLDIMNAFSHPTMGPAARAAFVGITGKEPYVTALRDRTGPTLNFFPGIPPKTKPGLPTYRARAWAAAKALNTFYTEGAESLGEATGLLEHDRNAKGNPFVKTAANILTPGLVGNASSPDKRAAALRMQRR